MQQQEEAHLLGVHLHAHLLADKRLHLHARLLHVQHLLQRQRTSRLGRLRTIKLQIEIYTINSDPDKLLPCKPRSSQHVQEMPPRSFWRAGAEAQSPESKTMLRQISIVQMDFSDTMNAMGIEAISAVSSRQPSRGGQQDHCMGSNRIQRPHNGPDGQPEKTTSMRQQNLFLSPCTQSIASHISEPFSVFQSKGYE